jgi:hypothetical protein
MASLCGNGRIERLQQKLYGQQSIPLTVLALQKKFKGFRSTAQFSKWGLRTCRIHITWELAMDAHSQSPLRLNESKTLRVGLRNLGFHKPPPPGGSDAGSSLSTTSVE